MIKFTGYIPKQDESDWVAGIKGNLVYEVNNLTANWLSYATDFENQFTKFTDFLDCVTESETNNLQEYIDLKIAIGEFKVADWKDFLIDGKVRVSKRYIAKLSGTTKKGNSCVNVAKAINTYGLIPEKDWAKTPDMTWEEFYADIPPELITKGKKILEKFTFPYEWVMPHDMEKHLKQAPLQAIISICGTWNSSKINYCGKYSQDHAVSILNASKTILDSYPPYIKTLSPDYKILALFKIIIKPKLMSEEQIKQLYRLTFKREPNEKAIDYYKGHSFTDVMTEIENSEEHKKYIPVFEAVKSVENWGRNG